MRKSSAILLSAILSLSTVSFVGCGGGGGEQSSSDAPVESKIISLADFEEWAPDFQLLRLFNNFGKVTRNSDAEYVYEGKYSAKLQPIGEYINKSAPTLYFTTTSNLFNFDYKDFTYYDEVVAQVYNATDKVQEMTIGCVSSVGAIRQISTAPGQTVTLQPGEWTRVDYWLDLDLLNLAANVQDICGVYFQFENAGVLDPDDGPTFYLDDVKLVKADEQRTINNLIQLDTGKVINEEKGYISNEVCDFEKPYQKYIAQSELAGTESTTFSLKVVNTAEYGIEAASGNNALLCIRHSAESASAKYSRILFPQALMQKVGMDKVLPENYKSTYFCFDVYNASKGDVVSDKKDTFALSAWFTYDGGKGLKAPYRLVKDEAGKDYGAKYGFYEYGEFDPLTSATHYAEYGKWTTYRISFYEIINGGCSEAHITTPGYLALLISAFVGEEDRLLFIDNLRLETGDPVYVKEME